MLKTRKELLRDLGQMYLEAGKEGRNSTFEEDQAKSTAESALLAILRIGEGLVVGKSIIFADNPASSLRVLQAILTDEED
ncbi:MAG: hypothetical protein WC824_11525 [Bacteroidota bacterium]|jgi:hypothetical protein